MSEMMPARNARSIVVNAANGGMARKTQRGLERIESGTLLRLAEIVGEGIAQVEKVHELDRLAREAMIGQAMLAECRAVCQRRLNFDPLATAEN